MGGSPLQVASRRFLPLAQHKHTPGYGSEDTKPHLAVHACVQSMLSATPSSGVVRPRTGERPVASDSKLVAKEAPQQCRGRS